jgi:Co/Zn/Cd efflux system component
MPSPIATEQRVRRAARLIHAPHDHHHQHDLPAQRFRPASIIGVGLSLTFHVWPLGTADLALTCHLVMPAGHPGDCLLIETARPLRERFGIGHPTLPIEVDATRVRQLAADGLSRNGRVSCMI